VRADGLRAEEKTKKGIKIRIAEARVNIKNIQK
jgi:hypothetical protein